jgi:hypothetical protein
MQEKHLYEYAVIRVLPFVEREEFINVGIILFCKKEEFINVLYTIDEKKLNSFSNKIDVDLIKQNLVAFKDIAEGKTNCKNPISQIDLPSRFRWLTAARSSSIQTSKPHPGLSIDLEKTAKQLFEELVL